MTCDVQAVIFRERHFRVTGMKFKNSDALKLYFDISRKSFFDPFS